MLLSKIKTATQYRLSGAKKLPLDIELSELFMEALYYVCNRCVPQELIREAGIDTDAVLRNIEDGAFIAIPETPDFTSLVNHLQIDENLTYACINYVCFLITFRADFKAIADELIYDYLANDGREYYVDIQTTI